MDIAAVCSNLLIPTVPTAAIAGSYFICCSQCTCLDAIEHLVEIHKSMFQRWQGHISEVSSTSAAVSTSVILSYLSWIEQVWSVKREYWFKYVQVPNIRQRFQSSILTY